MSESMNAKEVRVCIGHSGSVNCVRFTLDGSYCMSAGDDKAIKLFNPHRNDPNISTTNSQALLIKSYGGNHTYPIYDVVIAKDNSKFIAAGGDRNIFYYDVATGSIIRRIAGHSMKINAVAMNSDSTMLLSASDDKTMRAWDLRSNLREAVQVMNQFKDSVTSIDVSSSSIVAGSVDGVVRLFDLRSGQVHCDDISDPITSVKFSSNDRSILAMCIGGHTRILDVDSGRIIQEFTGYVHNSFKSEAVFSSDGKSVMCGSEKGSVWTYDVLTGLNVGVLPFNRLTSLKQTNKDIVINSLAHHRQNRLYLAALNDGTIRCVEY
jgi:mitogen-activated protein kinase organizer 1